MCTNDLNHKKRKFSLSFTALWGVIETTAWSVKYEWRGEKDLIDENSYVLFSNQPFQWLIVCVSSIFSHQHLAFQSLHVVRYTIKLYVLRYTCDMLMPLLRQPERYLGSVYSVMNKKKYYFTLNKTSERFFFRSFLV